MNSDSVFTLTTITNSLPIGQNLYDTPKEAVIALDV